MQRLRFGLLISLVFIHPCSMHASTDDQHPIKGITSVGGYGIQETTRNIMQRQAVVDKAPQTKQIRITKARSEDPSRKNLRVNSHSQEIEHYPFPHPLPHLLPRTQEHKDMEETRAPQTISLNFLGAQLSDSLEVPPDSMGTVGSSQFIVVINGRLRSFNKTTGTADGGLNVDLDTFFDPVRNGDFTSDPRVRYDRFSQRWFVTCINVPNSFDNNRIMIAVSDSDTITPSTIWTYFFFNVGSGLFQDYPTLGIDVNALYMGGVTFASVGNFNKVFVIRKSSILGAGPIVFTTFDDVIDENTGVGPYAPQGVDNFDPGATTGYFIGVNNAEFGSLVIRSVANPGGIPTLSANKVIVVPSTQLPILVPHLGNNHGFNGRLDSIDDRVFMAHVRNGHLWTAHNLGVNNHGISGSRTVQTRNGSRWYEINVSVASPTLVQAGTLFTSTPLNSTNQLSYWMPSLMTSGQGHMALGCSTAGSQNFINCATAGRLATDALGSIKSPLRYTNTGSSYNPAFDTGSSSGRRWGDFSYTSVDPCDDMTMWTIQEYCNTNNSWGVRVAKLVAPPPATPISSSPSSVAHGIASQNVTITGSSTNGSGFFDPGAGFSCRIGATVSGGVTVNSVTYTNPTHVTLNISTVGATTGAKNVTITNPDGQSSTGTGILTVT